MNLFTTRVVSVIRAIPRGFVMSYGQVAAAAGNPRGARQVVRILHSMSEKHALPWHRIINAKGEISLPGNDQRRLLESENVQFDVNGKINLTTYRWFPPDAEDE